VRFSLSLFFFLGLFCDCLLLALDIVFRFIIEYSSLRAFRGNFFGGGHLQIEALKEREFLVGAFSVISK
jgi:hypothetical protein